MAEPIWTEGWQPVVTVEQDPIGIGRLILDARFIAVGGEADVGVGDMSEGSVEVLLAVPRDVVPRGRALAQAAEDVDLPVRARVSQTGEGRDVQ